MAHTKRQFQLPLILFSLHIARTGPLMMQSTLLFTQSLHTWKERTHNVRMLFIEYTAFITVVPQRQL